MPCLLRLLDSLPLLVLDNLCEHLTQCDGRRSYSLASFALTSRRCAAVSASHRFRRITLEPQGSDDLVRIVDEARSFLGPERLGYVRELAIDGYVSPFDGTRTQDWDADDHRDLGDDDWPFHRSFEHSWLFNSKPAEMTLDTRRFMDQQWAPLLRFVECLPGLRRVRWISPIDVPPSLVQALEQRSPVAKLRIDALDMHGLYRPPGVDRQEMPLDEYTLAVSPALDAVEIPHHFDYDSSGRWNYHEDAVMEMVKTGNLIKPRLRHVAMTRQSPGATTELGTFLEGGPTRRPKWPGLRPSSMDQTPVSPQQGCLESLVLLGHGRSPLDIRDWSYCTDFAALARLELQSANLETLRILGEIANGDQLVALESLHLTIDQSHDAGGKADERNRAACRVLRALRPLQHLKLTDVEDLGLLDDILDRHGSSLRSLYFLTTADTRRHILELQQLERLSATCRRLQRLGVVIPRSQGDIEERAIYSVLGHMPLLETVSLHLACCPGDGAGGNEHSRATYRNMLCNAAVDADLAKSIFGVLAQSQMAETGLPYTCLPLYRVKITPLVDVPSLGELSFNSDVQCVLNVLGRSWVCERRSAGAEAREVHKVARLAGEAMLEPDGSGLGWLDEPDFVDAWEDLWGDAGIRGDVRWPDAWRSIPLDGGPGTPEPRAWDGLS